MRVTTARALVLLLALLSGGLVSSWVDAQGQWRHLAWQAPVAKAPELQPPGSLKQLASSAAPASYASIQERPLFAPDRRPPPAPPPPAPPPPPDPLADIHIYGVVSGSSPGILARVEGKMRRVKVDDKLGVWTLKAIDGRNITFAKDNETRQLKLAYAPLGAKTTSTTTPVAPAVAASAAGQSPANRVTGGSSGATTTNAQDAARENIRRRNEIRAARGLPMLTQ